MRERSRSGVALALGGLLGLAQFAIFFTDLPGLPGPMPRVAAAAALAVISGLALGRLRPAGWLPCSLLAAWGAIFWGTALGAMRVEGWAIVLAVPAALAALGGRLGAAWGRRSG